MSPLEETRIGCGRPLQASLDADDILGRLLAAGAWHVPGDDIQDAAAARSRPGLMCLAPLAGEAWKRQAGSR